MSDDGVEKGAAEKAPAEPEIQVFRSPVATVIWWVWLVFAAANLIDLAVQGRDHLAIVAALVLVFITSIVYATAKRPRLTAAPDGLTMVNPVTEHRLGWAAVAGVDPTDLLRVRCAWPGGDRALYAWSVHSSRRRQVSADMRTQRQSRRGDRGAGGFGAWSGGGGRGLGLGLGWSGAAGAAPDPSTEPDPLRVDAARVVASITERSAQVRRDEPDVTATAPVSAWHWPTIAAIVGTGALLLILLLV